MKKRILLCLAAMVVVATTACTNKDLENETTMVNDECLICGAPLEYLENDTLMECVICHK